MSTPELYEIYRAHPQVQTDTRKLQPGDLFFALRGPSFDGNAFARAALDAGAARAVIDDPSRMEQNCILVDDVLTALQELARHHRRQFRIPFIAITGSNGKTTTKELYNSGAPQKVHHLRDCRQSQQPHRRPADLTLDPRRCRDGGYRDGRQPSGRDPLLLRHRGADARG